MVAGRLNGSRVEGSRDPGRHRFAVHFPDGTDREFTLARAIKPRRRRLLTGPCTVSTPGPAANRTL